ncbi:MAG: SDR family oxidoreductase [Bacteroidia bacterium]
MKTVWITGASDGIGKALAQAWAKQEVNLVLSARREDKLREVAQSLGISENRYLVLPLDLEQLAEEEKLVQQVLEKFGKIDILVNNAALNQKSLAIETEQSVERKLMEVNFFGTIALSKAVAKQMQKQLSGQIVLISSIVAKYGNPFLSTYAASKHALDGYFESWRYELEKFKIQVTIVTPGFINTDLGKKALLANGRELGGQGSATTQNFGMNPTICAQKIIKAVNAGKKHSYIGGVEILFPYLRFLFPSLFYLIIKRLHKTGDS